jgi:hypothetical protein
MKTITEQLDARAAERARLRFRARVRAIASSVMLTAALLAGGLILARTAALAVQKAAHDAIEAGAVPRAW